jgi:integrase
MGKIKSFTGTSDKERNNEEAANRFRKLLSGMQLLPNLWLSSSKSRNGTNGRITFGKVWECYRGDHLPTISEGSRLLKVYRCERYLPPLFFLRMAEINPKIISEFVRFKRNDKLHPKKCNFDKELKDLKSIFNWYRDLVDFQFINPVKPAHFKLGVVSEIPNKRKEITSEQLRLFFGFLSLFYRDLAIIQFFCGARIGEIAGLQVKNIDLKKRVLRIQEVLIWIHGQPTIKGCPKSGVSREVFINDTMLEILERRLALVPDGCGLIFQHDGKPIRYATINASFNKAWQKAGLSQFSGTHLMRYAAAQFSRKQTGSLEGAMAVTGHKSIALVEKYSGLSLLDQNRIAVEMLEGIFKPDSNSIRSPV